MKLSYLFDNVILANNCMVNSTADLNKATVDIEKILIESTRDIVVPDSVTSCLWIGDRTNRNLSDFNIQYSSPSSLELVDLISTVRLSVLHYFLSVLKVYSKLVEFCIPLCTCFLLGEMLIYCTMRNTQ